MFRLRRLIALLQMRLQRILLQYRVLLILLTLLQTLEHYKQLLAILKVYN
jgi:hypothetical protein